MSGQSTEQENKPKSFCIVLPSDKTLALYFLSAVEKLVHSLNASRRPIPHIYWLASKSLQSTLLSKLPIQYIDFSANNLKGVFTANARTHQALKDSQLKKFDQLVVIEPFKFNALLIALIPARDKIVIGQANWLEKLFSTKQVAVKTRSHINEQALTFLSKQLDEPVKISSNLGSDRNENNTLDLHFAISDEQQLFTAEKLSFFPVPEQLLVIIHPFGINKEQSWHGEGFAKIADHLASLGFNVVLTGGDELQEKLLAEQIVSLATSRVLNLVGQTTIEQLYALQNIAHFVISADCWPLHSAALTHTPVIGLFHHRNPSIYGATAYTSYAVSGYQDAVQKEYKRPLAKLPWDIRPTGKHLMRGISVSQVKDKIRQLLADLN